MFIHLSHIVFSFYQIWCISAHPNVQFICTIGWVNIHFVSVDIAAVALTLGPRQIGNKKIPESFKNCSLIRQYHLLSSWKTLRTGILCHTLQIKSQNILIVFQIALWKLLLDEQWAWRSIWNTYIFWSCSASVGSCVPHPSRNYLFP